ncbi:MAG TPA: 50S ribosomal protein L9 [Jiangellales bacterium]|nr:50S ribosomal protein L9 [Jiangellales bacterium]
MKLILTQEVPGLGAPGDVVEVKGGYGRNYLVPQGYAIAWTRGGEKQISSIRQARSAREIADQSTADDVKARLEATTVPLTVRAGEGGRLFGSVSPGDIVGAVLAAGGPEVDKRKIEVRSPIKTVGVHEVTVRLHADVSATVRLDVVPA